MSREIGRIVIDLPVELELDEARTGRYDRRAVAQRFRELEFRSLIDRLPASSIAPTGYDSPEQETKGGLQLSLDLLGGRRPARSRAAEATPTGATGPAGRSRRGDRARRPADRARRTPTSTELDAWLEAHGDAVGLGWAVGSGRPLERRLFGIALAGADGSAWYVPCDPGERRRRAAAGRASRATDRVRIGHDLKQLVTTLWADRGLELRGHLRRHAGGRLHGATRRCGRRRSTTSPPRASAPSCRRTAGQPRDRRRGARDGAPRGRGGADGAARRARPSSRSWRRAAWRSLFDEVEMPLVPVLARMELAGVQLDLDALAAMQRGVRGPRWPSSRRGSTAWSGTSSTSAHRKQLETVLFDELGLAGHEADADRAARRTHRCSRSCATSTRWSALILEHRQVVEAEVDVRRRAADARRRRGPAAHDLPAGGRRHRAPVEHRSEPPEHPDPHRTRPPHPPRLRRAAGQAAARRRLLAAGAAHPRPRLRRRRAEGGLRRRTPTSTSPPRRASWAWRRSRSARRSAAWRR